MFDTSNKQFVYLAISPRVIYLFMSCIILPYCYICNLGLLQLYITIYYNSYTKSQAVTIIKYFDVLLAVHLSIFISVFNQLDAQNLFHIKFYFMPLHVSSTCAHHQEVKIALHSLWYHHTYRWLSSAQVERVLSQHL